jgi:aminoglycoside phosphotransferase (APT) family kinase protein
LDKAIDLLIALRMSEAPLFPIKGAPGEGIPSAQGEIAREALKSAFGSRPIQSIEPVAGGITSALVLKVQVGDRGYLLRAEGEPSPLRNPHQYESMRIAAEAGIAPEIRHLDEVARVVVMDFIEPRPLSEYPGGHAGLAQALGELLKRLQTTPVFPYFVEYPDIVARLFAHIRRTGLFAEGLLDRHVEHLENIRQNYGSGLQQLVSSHNDAHSGNLLFDGRRLWLIDWESACRNDRMVDLAILSDSFGFSPDLATLLVNTWLGRIPDAGFYDRFQTVRALTRLYFAGVFLSMSAASQTRPAPDTDLSIPTVAAFDKNVRDEMLSRPERFHTLGKMYLASFLSGSAVPKFGASDT